MTRLSTFDALGRGSANARANFELIVASFVGTLILVAIVLAAIVPWMATIGLDASWLWGDTKLPDDLPALWRLASSPAELLARIGSVILSLTVALTLASIVFCWYFGGILGVLVAADAQAPAGAGRESILFRAWSRDLFFQEARRLVWKVMLYYSLFGAIWFFVALLCGGAVAAAVLIGAQAGVGAGFAVGCGALLPLLFVLFAVLAAMQIGVADLPRHGSGARAATRAGFTVLGRRLGASLLIVVFFFVASAILAAGFTTVEIVVDLALSAVPLLALALRCVLFGVQLFVGAALNIAAAASFVALLRNELATDGVAQPG